jgi:hypothetical protein
VGNELSDALANHRHDTAAGGLVFSPFRFTRQFQRQCAATRADNALPQLKSIAGKNPYAFPAPRSRDVPLLIIRGCFDGGIREQHVVHSFALGGIGRDGVTPHKFTVVLFQDASIGQADAAIR